LGEIKNLRHQKETSELIGDKAGTAPALSLFICEYCFLTPIAFQRAQLINRLYY